MSKKPEAGLLNKRLMLSSSFRCDQIYKNEIFGSHFVGILKSGLNVQQTRLRALVPRKPFQRLRVRIAAYPFVC